MTHKPIQMESEWRVQNIDIKTTAVQLRKINIYCSANKEDQNLLECYNEVIAVQRNELQKTGYQTHSQGELRRETCILRILYVQSVQI